MRTPLLPMSCLVLALCACQPTPPATNPSATSTAVATSADPANNADKSEASQNAGLAEIPVLKISTIDGNAYDLASKRGRWVVVNFWATWCGPCIKEMPELDAFDAGRDDVEVLGLAYEEIAPEEMRAFLIKRPVKYPIAIVDTYNPPADFPTPRGLPMTYVIGPDGKVVKEFMGPVTQADLSAAIGGKPAAESVANDKAAASG